LKSPDGGSATGLEDGSVVSADAVPGDDLRLEGADLLDEPVRVLAGGLALGTLLEDQVAQALGGVICLAPELRVLELALDLGGALLRLGRRLLGRRLDLVHDPHVRAPSRARRPVIR
jgi:hypothetical protein